MASDSPGTRPPRPSSYSRVRWRYLSIVTLICLAIVGAAAAGWHYARTSGPAYGPVVLVSIDALRADHLPAYGYTGVKTPAIDALAADGIVFDRAFAHSPQTLPSNVSLLSGRLPFETGVRDNVGFTVPAGLFLLPQFLHRRGFKTGGVVSNYLLRQDTGLGQAFGFFDDEMRPRAGEPAEQAVRRDGAASLEVAERWVDLVGTSRFFLFLQIDEPAAPGAPPARFAGLPPYDGRIAYADEIVGRLVGHLQSRGLYDGAVLVLLSDHGEGLGDHGERGHGLLLHGDVLRTPLIVKMPRQALRGRRTGALVQHIDIVPTILDLMGAPTPSGLRGRSLRRVLDSPDTVPVARSIYAESLAGHYAFGWSGLVSITDGSARLVRAPRPELYDLRQDPGEQRNDLEARATVATALGSALDRMIAGTTLQRPAPIGAEQRDRLAALGYVNSTTSVSAAGGVPAAPQIDPNDRVATFEQFREATRLAGQGQVPEAVAAYRDVVARDPECAPAREQLGRLLIRSSRFKEAGDALSGLIALCRKAGCADEAGRVVQELGTASPSADEYALTIRLWTALGDKDQAAEVRAAARKAVGDAALRRAEAAQR